MEEGIYSENVFLAGISNKMRQSADEKLVIKFPVNSMSLISVHSFIYSFISLISFRLYLFSVNTN